MENSVSLVTEAPLPWTVHDADSDGETAVVGVCAAESDGHPDVFSWIDLIVSRNTALLVTE